MWGVISLHPQVDKYALSMTLSTAPSKQPRLIFEPYHATKKASNIQQWVSAFNIFVSVYTERYQSETQQLMKYCEVNRDIALSNGGIGSGMTNYFVI